jgi:hypothetical protein
MPRFSKGTTDHDGDGHMGGSRKGDATMAKKPARKRMTRAEDTPEAQPTKVKAQQAAADQFAEADAAAADGGEIKLRMAALGGY